jgi:hypothetical protein
MRNSLSECLRKLRWAFYFSSITNLFWWCYIFTSNTTYYFILSIYLVSHEAFIVRVYIRLGIIVFFIFLIQKCGNILILSRLNHQILSNLLEFISVLALHSIILLQLSNILYYITLLSNHWLCFFSYIFSFKVLSYIRARIEGKIEFTCSLLGLLLLNQLLIVKIWI